MQKAGEEQSRSGNALAQSLDSERKKEIDEKRKEKMLSLKSVNTARIPAASPIVKNYQRVPTDTQEYLQTQAQTTINMARDGDTQTTVPRVPLTCWRCRAIPHGPVGWAGPVRCMTRYCRD